LPTLSILAHSINQQALFHRIQFLNQVALSMLNNSGFVAKQIIVQKQFFHLTLEERLHGVVEVGWVFVSDEDV